MNLVLIGLRGSGKTVCGRLLAAHLGWPFVDTDALVQARAGRTIRELFAAEGERGFRAREAAVVREVAAGDRQVIATGGGAVLDPDNVAALRRNGFVVHLAAPPAVLHARISGDAKTADERPRLIANAEGVAELERLQAARAECYRLARDLEIGTENRAPEEIVPAILAAARQAGRELT